MSDPVARGLFDALVKRVGGVDAAAAAIEARWGQGCKGTVSKMAAGHLDISLGAMVAVEDFAGAWPITLRLAERLVEEQRRAGDVAALTAQAALAAGAAQAAVIDALAPGGAGGVALTRGEMLHIATRMRALRDVADQIVRTCEAGG